MNKRLTSIARICSKGLCTMLLLGSLYACKDDYKWDDTTPGYLNSSIYDYLKSNGNYTNYVKLIDDLDYAEVLDKTGSKTLFVADDNAFADFYANNAWGAKSYDQLTTSQKKLLLNSSMLNNAYLLEMMSSTTGPNTGQCLRRETSSTVLDSVPHFNADELPTTYNESDKDYWKRFRTPEKGGIYMALDNTSPMMTHFLATQMRNKGITDNDFKVIMGVERDKNDAYVYDCKVVEGDIVCQNGYINRLDKVLITPQNMAEVIRTNDRTQVFSHMLDRFSAPFYNAALTASYRLLYGNQVDSVFEKRYFNTQTYRPLRNDAGTDPVGNPSGNAVAYGLTFDPGWNHYQPNDKIAKEQDMGVMFVPTDAKLYEYFFSESGGGRFLLEAYAPEELANVKGSSDYEGMYRALDQIPLSVIQALINNLMKEQFCNAVPSKFETIKDDAQDPMLDDTHIQYIDDVLFANNGAIYLMNEVLTPAQYAAVSAPAYVSKDMRVFNYAVQKLTWNGSAKNFYAYLLAMSSRFSLFVPKDGFWYIDPASFKNGLANLRAVHFEWNSANSSVRGDTYPVTYDFATKTYTIGDSPVSSGAYQAATLYDRLNDILETHTIVHEDQSDIYGIDETATGVECNKHYFIAKNGAPVYVENATSRANGMTVKGGWGIEHNESANVIRFDDKTKESNGNGNGMAYQLDGPIIPTYESIYSIMYNNRDKFGKFYDLCLTDNQDILTILEPFLNRDEEGEKIFTSNADYLNRYTIFVNNGGIPCYDNETGAQVTAATNVRFFSNYRYTVYMPTDAAIEAAFAKGLPTWEEIAEYLKIDDATGSTTLEDEELNERGPKAAAMVTQLINFLKYHFQDNSVFADTPAMNSTQYETATMNSETGVYCKVTVSSTGGNTLTVSDANGASYNVMNDYKNLLARDYIIKGSSNALTINASSFAVMHGIDGVLDYKSMPGGRYDSDWSSAGAAKRFLSKYRITQ